MTSVLQKLRSLGLSDLKPVYLGGSIVAVASAVCYFLYRSKKVAQSFFCNTHELIRQLQTPLDFRVLLQNIQQKSHSNPSLVALQIEQTVVIKSDKLTLQLCLMTALKKKADSKSYETKDPFSPPFEPGIYIAELGSSHRLLLNKFYIHKGHCLVVTKNFKPQQARLDPEDFEQTLRVQGALNGIFYYNCGSQSGASQSHRHFQVLPHSSRELPIIKQLLAHRSNLLKQKTLLTYGQVTIVESLDFIHGIVWLDSEKREQLPKQTYKAYQLLRTQVIMCTQSASFNLVGTEEFLMMVPRLTEKAFEEVSINSVGFAGSILIKDKETFQRYKSYKPESILCAVTYSDKSEFYQQFPSSH